MLEPSDVVDREVESRRFQELLAEEASRRVLAISDDSGWGKSALLHKLQHICEYHDIPVALVKLDELLPYPDEISVAEEVAMQLRHTGIQLESFEKLNKYRSFQDVAAFIDAYRSMSGEISVEGASVSGGQVAALIINAERVQSIGMPDWTPDAAKQAKLLCLDAFASDLFRSGRSHPVVILLDAFQKADQDFRRWFFHGLMRKHMLGGGVGGHRCLVVLAGERLEQMLRAQFPDYDSHFECISALSSWQLADTKRMLEVHKIQGLRPHQIKNIHRDIVARITSLTGALAIADAYKRWTVRQ
jgi:AAA ATPase domain